MRTGQGFHILVLFFLLIFQVFYGYSAEIAPESSVKIVKKNTDDPEWKISWDAARDLANRKSYKKAIEQYRKVLALKPNIEEVQWELSKTLAEVGDYEESSLLLQNLLEIDNRRVVYLITAGRVAMLAGNFEQATTFFGQALEVAPTGKFAVEAQKGFVEGLIAQGKSVLALPLMEQLLAKGELNAELIRNTAKFALETGDEKKSAYYYRQLIEKFRVAPEILLEAATVFEKIENYQEALKLWEKYLEFYPDSVEYLEKAAEFYLQKGKYNGALPHIVKLIELNVNLEKYLLEAGRIFLYYKGRADRALSYYERYRNEFPDGIDVQKKISDIQLILANDFLSIVENDGVWILWRDLAKVTPDRIGIYRAMADLLLELKKKNEYMEVLQIINLHQPDDFETALKLALLYRDDRKYGKCLSVLKPFAGNITDPRSYYLLKAECEEKTGDDIALLDTLINYLNVFQDDTKTRCKAAGLAGDLGNLHVLAVLAGKTLKEAQESGKVNDLVFIYIDSLIKNRHLEKALKSLELLIGKTPSGSMAWVALTGKRALILKLQNRSYDVEQELRQRSAFAPDAIEPILDLAENSLESADISSLRIWLSLAQKKISLKDDSRELETLKSRVRYLGMRFDELKGKNQKYQNDAEEYLLNRQKNKHLAGPDLKILIYLVEQKYRQGEYKQGKFLLERYKENFIGNREYHSISNMVNEKFKPENEKGLYLGLGIVELYDVFESLVAADDEKQAENVLKIIMSRPGDRSRAMALAAELYFDTCRYEDALKLYEELVVKFPKEAFFKDRILECDYLAGRNDSFLARIKENADEQLSDADITEIGKAILSPAVRRQLARILWMKGDWQDAIQVYEDLELVLNSKVSDSVKKLENVYMHQLETMAEGDFRDFLLREDRHNTELLSEIMSPSFFTGNLGNQFVQELAGMYSSYRWLEVTRQEYAAKRALNSKKFYQAEKEYEELIEDEEYGSDVYPDLATIYSRLGKHTKETEMIEKIKEIKSVYPAMKTTAERNIRQRQPNIYYEGMFLKEEGREGLKDLSKFYNGAGFRMQPTIFQQFGLEAGWNTYKNTNDSDKLQSLDLQVNYSIFFNDYLEAGGEFGLEEMSTSGDSYLKYDLYAKGTSGESVEVHVGLSQDVVADNLEVLDKGVYSRSYGAGLTFDPVPSVFVGFDFDVVKYSDSNEGKTFNVWSSYRFFTDTSKYDFTYRYMKIENNLENGETIPGASADPQFFVNYWSPGTYWRHLLSFEYRRELWPLGRFYSGTSWFSAKYGIGYESYESVVHMLEADIYLEIHPRFLLKGTLIFDRTEDYDRNEGFLSLVYRW